MTESEWLACDDLDSMLRFVAKHSSRRKEKLFAVACCRRVEQFICLQGQKMLAAAERAADEPASVDDFLSLYDDAMAKADGLSYRAGTPNGCARWQAANAVWAATDYNPFTAALESARAVKSAAQDPATFDVGKPGPPCPGDPFERAAQIELLRCIVSNPFRRVALSPHWRTPIVIRLAEESYTDLAFDQLPILADALEDAGCTNADILTHLRSPGPHVRGCWPLDLILGKQ